MLNATDLQRWAAARRVRQQRACRWSASATAAGWANSQLLRIAHEGVPRGRTERRVHTWVAISLRTWPPENNTNFACCDAMVPIIMETVRLPK